MKTKSNLKKSILTAVTGFFVLFIFSNSLAPADVSGGASSRALEIVQSILAALRWNVPVTEHFLRKAGHFSEYLALGLLLAATLRAYMPRAGVGIFLPLFAGLLTAVLDETIQLFVEGRSGQISDVLLDFSGVLAGLGLFFGVAALCRYVRDKRSVSPENA